MPIEPDVQEKTLIELEGAGQKVNLVGNVFRHTDTDNPVRKDVKARMTYPAELFLEKGKYVYEFDVHGGGGEFKVNATGAGSGSMTCKTALGAKGKVLRFRVSE